jgi:hypothetical protein
VATYSAEAVRQIQDEAAVVLHDLNQVGFRVLTSWHPTLKSPRAQEHLAHGVGRRLTTLERCVTNIFEICPVDHDRTLDEDERTDLDINLHAFVVNVHGLMDNLAWVTVFEHHPDPLPSRQKVSLFRKDGPVAKYLNAAAIAYLKEPKTRAWYHEYAVGFRDSLVHRIPLFVPPFTLDPPVHERFLVLGRELAETGAGETKRRLALYAERASLGTFVPGFMQSFFDPDKSKPVLFHPQLVVDVKTLLEIVRAVCPVPI